MKFYVLFLLVANRKIPTNSAWIRTCEGKFMNEPHYALPIIKTCLPCDHMSQMWHLTENIFESVLVT